MPTFKICVFEHQQRKDGKFRVSIRLTHKRERAYLKTDTYVVRKQIMSDFSALRDRDTARQIDQQIIRYERILLRELGSNLNHFTAKELVKYIEIYLETEGGTKIDFIAFSKKHIASLKTHGKKSYAEGFEAVLRALTDFFGREVIYIKEINSNNLIQFAEYMQTTRCMVRVNQFGKEYTIERKAASPQTVSDYLRRIQTLFNVARDHYNEQDDEISVVTHNPFRKQIVKVSEEPRKRDLSVTDLLKIIN